MCDYSASEEIPIIGIFIKNNSVTIKTNEDALGDMKEIDLAILTGILEQFKLTVCDYANRVRGGYWANPKPIENGDSI